MNISVTKRGNDNSTFVMSTTSTPAYPDFDGKKAFGAFAEITEDQMQKLSLSDFMNRVYAWRTHLQETYQTSDPNMWDDISPYFKYVRGVVVRLISTNINKQYKATIYPEIAQEAITATFEDPYDNISYQMTILPNAHTSDVVNLSTESPTTDEEIGQGGGFQLVTPEFGEYIHYYATEDIIQTIYPIP